MQDTCQNPQRLSKVKNISVNFEAGDLKIDLTHTLSQLAIWIENSKLYNETYLKIK